jgi:hypothetical protein
MIGQRRLVGSLVPLSIQQTKLVPPLIFNLAYGVTVKLGKMKKKKKKKKKNQVEFSTNFGMNSDSKERGSQSQWLSPEGVSS